MSRFFLAAYWNLNCSLSRLLSQNIVVHIMSVIGKSHCFKVIRSQQVLPTDPYDCDGSGPFGKSQCESFQNERK